MPEDPVIDATQLDALAKLEAEQRAIRELVEKATHRRDKELEVYARVVADYEARMTASVEQAKAIRQRVRDDFQKLEQQYHKQTDALKQARTQLQECEFRHEIGEFNQEQFERCQQDAKKAIAAREAEFQSVSKLRLRYQELLPNDPPPVMVPPPAAPPPPVAAAAPPPAAPPPPVAAAAPPLPPTMAGDTPLPGKPRTVPPPMMPAPVIPVAPPSAAPPSPTPAARKPMPMPMPTASDQTMVMAPPSPDAFKVPKADKESEAFATKVVQPAVLIEDLDGVPGAPHRLGAMTTIGRAADNQIELKSKEASRRHAQIVSVDGGYVLKDLGSPNGTMVNGERITAERRLKEGDKIAMAGKLFTFKAP